jgi:hypothetical protein
MDRCITCDLPVEECRCGSCCDCDHWHNLYCCQLGMSNEPYRQGCRRFIDKIVDSSPKRG